MDCVEPILAAAETIYKLVETVKANKKRCQRVCERVRALVALVKSIQETAVVQRVPAVEKTLQELSETLQLAQQLIGKYTSANLVKRILKANSHTDDFNSLNERLNDAAQALALALQVEQGNAVWVVFEAVTREREDRQDGTEDDAELQKLLLEHVKNMENELREVKEGVAEVLALLRKPKITDEEIRKIEPEKLTFIPDFPRKPFMTTSTSEVYKGQYHGYTVAIKRFTDPMNISPGKLESIFNKEVSIMKRLESPHILRMFGICIQNQNAPTPDFFIIMEYCQKGTLRHVLDSTCQLSWMMRARMCLHATSGLYQLHQTDDKSRVHGCISSSKFLVADGYVLKLGGFELAKTETSLKRTTMEGTGSSLCYSSPQQLSDINHPYSRECEMYSLGIVLWEIATRRNPFEGFSSEKIVNKVSKEGYVEPLPPDCPEALAALIDGCRAREAFSRPSAGVLLDKLHRVVVQLEEDLLTSVDQA